mgnify:CR=1 FL=1
MKPNRHSIRLKGYDYSAEGAYFVTMVCKDRLHWFGEVTDGKMQLSEAGNIVEEEWLRGAELRSEITLDAYVVMPNHFHGIVVIGEPLIPLEAIRCRAFATRGNGRSYQAVSCGERCPQAKCETRSIIEVLCYLLWVIEFRSA